MIGRFKQLADGVLGIPTFRRYWVGQIASEIGDALFTVALPLEVYARTGSVATMASLVVARWLPTMLVAPWSGVLADRFRRQYLMFGFDLARALIVAMIPFFSGNWQFVVSYFLLAACSQVFEQARMGLIPGIVPKEKLASANLISHGAGQVIFVAGPGLAGLLIAWIGTDVAFYLDALSFLFSAFWLVRLTVPAGAPRPPMNMGREIAEGWQVIRGKAALTWSLIIFGVALVGSMPLNILQVPFLVGTLAADPARFGIITSIFAGTALVGTVATSWLVGRINRIDLIAGGITLLGMCGLGYSLSPNLQIAVCFYGLTGLCNGLIQPLNTILLQEQTPENFHGRVYGLYSAVTWSMALLAGGATGILGERFGVRPVMAAGCLIIVVSALGSLALPWYRSAKSIYKQPKLQLLPVSRGGDD